MLDYCRHASQQARLKTCSDSGFDQGALKAASDARGAPTPSSPFYSASLHRQS